MHKGINSALEMQNLKYKVQSKTMQLLTGAEQDGNVISRVMSNDYLVST
jgi:hypothetical protein